MKNVGVFQLFYSWHILIVCFSVSSSGAASASVACPVIDSPSDYRDIFVVTPDVVSVDQSILIRTECGSSIDITEHNGYQEKKADPEGTALTDPNPLQTRRSQPEESWILDVSSTHLLSSPASSVHHSLWADEIHHYPHPEISFRRILMLVVSLYIRFLQ